MDATTTSAMQMKCWEISKDKMQFLIQIYDRKTECIATEISFEVNQVAELPPLLGLKDFNPMATYELDGSDIQRINDHFD